VAATVAFIVVATKSHENDVSSFATGCFFDAQPSGYMITTKPQLNMY
jgi:hypothetical protein